MRGSARVRAVDLGEILIDGLELLGLRARAPVLVAIAEAAEPLHEGDARAFGPCAKSSKYFRVADRLRVDEEAHFARQLAHVLQVEAIAVAGSARRRSAGS